MCRSEERPGILPRPLLRYLSDWQHSDDSLSAPLGGRVVRRIFKGHVDSIQAGSGTAFSLPPAENATGNFVKIVQRVPVKIVFDEPPDVLLGPGMSVVPTVRTK